MKSWSVFVALGLMGVAAQSQAGLLYSFEAGTEGWYNPSWSTGDTTITQDTVGATHMSHSARVDWPAGAGFRWLIVDDISQAFKADLKGSTKVMIDFTIPSGFPSNWFNGKFFYNRGDGGWYESPQVNYPTSGMATVEFNISGITANIDLGQWARIGFAINSDTTSARTFYIDNIRTDNPVPEPATLAVLGLGALALVRRRK